MKISEIKTVATRIVGRTGLKIQKHSPEILMAVGTVAVIGGVVMACKATLHAEEVVDQHNSEMDTIRKAEEISSEYTESDMKKDKTLAYIHTVGRFGKLYAPAVALTTFGISCYFGAYGIMKKRYVAVVAAYDGLQKAFSEYRDRVKKRLGDYEEKLLYMGTTDDELGDDGEMSPIFPEGYKMSMYSRCFDETSTQWTRNAELNKMNLCNWQNWANDLLNARGHVFLNEVYDMLGFQRTKEGSVVGWVKHGDGDGYIDFGMMNIQIPKVRDFVNGYEKAIWLDFNVDGVIYDKI